MIPPPNVTGSLHIGHAFTLTLQDVIVRWKRMSGFDTLWLPGLDHAGIATQMVVERQLAKEGKKKEDLGREEFEKRVWQWKEESGGQILKQLRLMGFSLDWSRERFTMDAGHVARRARGLRLALRAGPRLPRLLHRQLVPALRDRAQRPRGGDASRSRAASGTSAIAEPDGGPGIVVATTRPETLLGDTAVAVHPDDERYRHLVGQDGGAARARARDPGGGGHLRGPRVRHRRGEDHPRARPQRLRGRAAPGPAVHQHHGRARGRSTRTPGPTRARTGSRRAKAILAQLEARGCW